jgi:hypothetical protein
MNMTNLCLHASSERLTLYFYGELSDVERRAVDEHLDSCDACASAIAELRVMRAVLSHRGNPSRTTAEWDGFMARLLPKLDADGPENSAQTEVRPVRMTGRAMALAAALLIAVGAGLMWQRTALEPGRTVAADGRASDAALTAAAEQHFERAKLVVLGLAMKDPAQTTAADWEHERQLAASLLPETRLYRLSAADRGDTRLASLLGDLESVLLQASMTSDAEPSELERLQRAIRRRDLLVRMDLREL